MKTLPGGSKSHFGVTVEALAAAPLAQYFRRGAASKERHLPKFAWGFIGIHPFSGVSNLMRSNVASNFEGFPRKIAGIGVGVI